MTERHSESGFSLIELLVATGLLLMVSAIVTTALMQMTQSQKTIWNRTEMHSGIRGATELLQQEVGQAGRIATRADIVLTLSQATTAAATCDPAAPATNSSWYQVSTVSGLFADSTVGSESYAMVTTMDGNIQESVRVAQIDTGTPNRIRACFKKVHAINTVLIPLGGFATGILPDNGFPNGSTVDRLKMYGDINGDGKMVYIEYFCDSGGSHNLYRNVMDYDAGARLPLNDSKILLSNVYPNDPDLSGTARPCFKYQTATIPTGTPVTAFTFVTDVAVTLTVQTQEIDPITQQYQRETKALLNISPRNVFAAWSLAGLGYTDRIQSTPTTIKNLALVTTGT